MLTQNRTRLRMVAAMAIFGTLGPFVRHIPVTSGQLALYRAILAAALLGGYLLLRRQPVDGQAIKKALPLLLLSGAVLAVNWILLFEAYRYTTVSMATLSYYFAPMIVTAVSPLLFREKLTRRQLVCFLLSTVGLILITGVGKLSAGSDHLRGIAYGLGAAVFYAGVVLLNKYIPGVTGIHRTFFQFLAAVVVMLPYTALTDGVVPGPLGSIGWVCLLTVGLLHTGITYCMYFSALKALPGQKAAILSYVDPLVAVVISVTLLQEPLRPSQLLGGALILGFTLLNEWERN